MFRPEDKTQHKKRIVHTTKQPPQLKNNDHMTLKQKLHQAQLLQFHILQHINAFKTQIQDPVIHTLIQILQQDIDNFQF
jgi:hypothetical protein